MSRYQVINPETLGAPRGFNHGLLAAAGGRLLFVAGQIGRDPAGRMSSDFVEQFDRALDNALAEGLKGSRYVAEIGRILGM